MTRHLTSRGPRRSDVRARPKVGAKPVAWSQVVAVCLPHGRHAGRPRRPGGRRRIPSLLRGEGPSGLSRRMDRGGGMFHETSGAKNLRPLRGDGS